jgi:hypothetical protein
MERIVAWPRLGEGVFAQLGREQPPLALGQLAEMAHFGDLKPGEELASAVAAPAALAHEQL